MIDADIAIAIKGVLDAAITAQAPFTATVSQSGNPVARGPGLQAQVFFTKILARRWGAQSHKEVYDSDNNQYISTHSWYLRATYQISTLMNQDVGNPASLNAYDVVDFCAAVLQTPETIAALKATGTGIGIDRIMDIATPRSWDDSDRYNLDATFDFVLSYQNTITTIVPEASVTGIIERV